MATETVTETTATDSTTTKAVPPPTHADIFFRNVAALCQVSGIQAFTFAVAVPKEDGTSSVLSVAAGPQGATAEWKEEISRLLGENAVKAAATIAAPAEKPAEVV